MSHTKEPWKVKICRESDSWYIEANDDGYEEIHFLTCISGATCARIVACVNACAEFSDEELELELPSLLRKMQVATLVVEKQRDELVAALKLLQPMLTIDLQEYIDSVFEKAGVK